MNRNDFINSISEKDTQWDLAIIGGGATGVGVAIEAASRGYSVVLVEQSDFGKATSSRSTKLAHGGVRYLQQGNISLVLDALRERGIMRQNAPHVVHDMPFIVPLYDWWEGPFYGIGLKIYDLMAGKAGFGHSKILSKESTISHIPTLETKGLKGGVIYYDGQFDDTRLLINMVQTAAEHGASMLNYMKATSIIKENDEVKGLIAQDQETGQSYSIKAKVVVNATGVFADSIRRMDDEAVQPIMTSSQGIHIILDKSFLPGDSAIMVPHTADGRVLFAIPWYNTTLVGTTDTKVEEFPIEPIALEEEVNFILSHAAKYLTKDPTRSDVKSVFVGLRPLVSSTDRKDTASIARDHTIAISRSGLVSIVGGKWTTYRRMAEETVEQAMIIADLPPTQSVTKTLRIHGYRQQLGQYGELSIYGSDESLVKQTIAEDPSYNEPVHPSHPILKGEIVWAIRKEMARTVEDFLSRRSRLLLLDAKASIEAAPMVASIMAKELNKDKEWEKNQIDAYEKLAKNYLLAY